MVDSDRRLVGILTVDDALQILEDADSQDQDRISGAETLRQPYLTTTTSDAGAFPGGVAVGAGHRCGADGAGARHL